MGTDEEPKNFRGLFKASFIVHVLNGMAIACLYNPDFEHFRAVIKAELNSSL